MLQMLPLVLFIVLAEVSIGSICVLVFLDWRREVKRGFLVSYGLIYLGLIGLLYLFQQNFATPELLDGFTQLDKTWIGYLTIPLLLFFLFMIPYNVLLWIDRNAGVDGGTKKVEEAEEEEKGEEVAVPAPRVTVLGILRVLSGAAIVLSGLATLLVISMIFRPLASSNFAGFATVAGFFAASFALGGVMTAMWLGHWYLVTPALSERPLQFSTTLVLVAILTQILFTIISGPNTAHAVQPGSSVGSTPPAVTTPVPTGQVKPAGAPVVTPLSTDAIGWLRILVSFAIPLVLGGLAWKLIRDRSFQSATGMLYLVVVCTLAGEAMARGLFLLG